MSACKRTISGSTAWGAWQVRKAAVRILWESCIRAPDFPRASEACVAVLHRVGDNEESILELVAKVFHGLWFAGTSSNSKQIA